MEQPTRYHAQYQNLTAETYIKLRVESGLSSKTKEAAEIGLANSLCTIALVITGTDEIIGMGRLIGDGGCHCQVADICVLPSYQGKGLSKLIMQKIEDYIDQHIPDSCYINLIADGTAYKLYEKYRFKAVYPASRGMGYVVKRSH